MKVITDKEYVRDYINGELDSVLDKLNKDEDVSIEKKYIGTRVVKELKEAELTDNEVVNLYNVCDYNKFVNLIGALEMADVLNCSNTNEMIKKLTIIIWCHYENYADMKFDIDNIFYNTPRTLSDIAKTLKDKEDKKDDNYDFDTDNYGFDNDLDTNWFDDSIDEILGDPFGEDTDPFGGVPANNINGLGSILEDVNTDKEDEESLDKLIVKIIDRLHNKEAYNKFKDSLKLIKDLMENGD